MPLGLVCRGIFDCVSNLFEPTVKRFASLPRLLLESSYRIRDCLGHCGNLIAKGVHRSGDLRSHFIQRMCKGREPRD